MNERIKERVKELREQAWELVSNEERARGELYDAREQWERCDQKFAELIILECADIAYKTSRDDLVHDYGQEAIPLHLFNTIKHHFGVEQ